MNNLEDWLPDDDFLCQPISPDFEELPINNDRESLVGIRISKAIADGRFSAVCCVFVRVICRSTDLASVEPRLREKNFK